MSVPDAWCRTYTRLVPADEGERRRAEVNSHVHDARASGVSATRLALETGVGCGADLLWSDGVRRHRGLVTLPLIPFLDATVGAVIGGVIVLLAFLWSTVAQLGQATQALTTLALVLACSGHVAAAVRRWRR